MSGSGKDDLLGRFLHSPRESGKRQDVRPASSSEIVGDTRTGLNPLDLLGLPPAQRDVINWLSRRKQARFDEIQEALGVETSLLTSVLSDLKAERHVQEALIDGEIYYRVVFGGKVSRAARGLPEGIWERVDLDDIVFLRQVSIFRGLPDHELREVSSRLDSRRYHRNEVILWQGGLGEGVYFIKSGIVGITRLSPDKRDTQILTYLKQGDLMGEYGLLFEQNIAASATATALSEVDVLVMKREDLLDMLKKHPSAAIELVQLLAQRLLTINAQLAHHHRKNSLCLVFGVDHGVGCTTIGSVLALKLAQLTQNSTVYTEHPVPTRLAAQFEFTPETEVYAHPGGYDILVPYRLSGVPPAVRTTLVMDRLMNNYANIVVGLSGTIDETVIYMLERADQVVVVTPPDALAWEKLDALLARLRAVISPEKTSLSVVCNRSKPAYVAVPECGPVDFDVPLLDSLLPLAEQAHHNLPQPLVDTMTVLADRLGRTNQIGVYIPATLEANPGANTRTHVDQTVEFLGKLFGTSPDYPTSAETKGKQAGMAGESIYIVQTYVTKSDMDQHLGALLEYVEKLKTTLGQEVVALEVNHNIMLV